ncbi:MAG: hypothetical protein ACT4ON_08470 [Bacteroidota bacterium]
MKKILFVLFIFTFSITDSKAQSAFAPTTGDVEIDGILKNINEKAKDNLEAFAKDVSTKFDVVKSKIEKAIKTMHPGDVFMSAQVASIIKKPFEEVTKTFEANKHKGWGTIAKDLGIKPGSAEFHEMKKVMKSHGDSKGNGKGNGKGKEKDKKK